MDMRPRSRPHRVRDQRTGLQAPCCPPAEPRRCESGRRSRSRATAASGSRARAARARTLPADMQADRAQGRQALRSCASMAVASAAKCSRRAASRSAWARPSVRPRERPCRASRSSGSGRLPPASASRRRIASCRARERLMACAVASTSMPVRGSSLRARASGRYEPAISGQQFVQGRGRTGLALRHGAPRRSRPSGAGRASAPAHGRRGRRVSGWREPSGRQAGQLFAPPVQLAAGDLGFIDAECGVVDFMAEAGQRGSAARAPAPTTKAQGQRQFGMRQRPLRLETRQCLGGHGS